MLRRRPSRRATTTVETAAVALVCFLLMFGIFEYGRYVFARQVMENAARAGARVAVVTPTSYLSAAAANAAIDTAVKNAVAGSPVQGATWTAYEGDNSGNNVGLWTTAPFSKQVVVQVDADLALLFPYLGYINPGASPNSIHITVKAMMRSEAN
jgi:Flp pilus assembly protein TadG